MITTEVKEINKLDVFVAEVSKTAVMDIASTNSVACQIWFEDFKSNLNKQTLKEIETFPSITNYFNCWLYCYNENVAGYIKHIS